MSRFLYIVLILFLFASDFFAQTPIKLPVYVDHIGEDFIGRQITFQTMAKLRESAAYAQLDTAFNGELGFFRIMITTVATNESEEWSAISVVYTLDLPESPFGKYLNSAVYFRHAKNLTDLVDKIMFNLDAAINNYATWQKIKDKR